MTIKEIGAILESIAPVGYQESYDNSGLLVGDAGHQVTGALITLDVTEAVIDEAIGKDCNLIIAHHPLIFSGVKRITGSNLVERCIIKAIQSGVAIYAIHTNLDNVAHGVNRKIAEKLGLINTRILAPKGDTLQKIVCFAPIKAAHDVREAMFNAGAGHIGNYSHCSFNTEGEGTFQAEEGTNPHVGEVGSVHHEGEVKIEMVVATPVTSKVVGAMKSAHPYEEVAYDLYAMLNKNDQVGSGMIGELEEAMGFDEFMSFLKNSMKTDCIRHTAKVADSIKKVAFCGGSGSFLLGAAMGQQADIFITGDYKYHQFFDADGKIVIADIGHFESEQFTPELLGDLLKGKFPNFALHLSEINTNPIYYI
jgi:dinuclear metal center YbgI/SA1388 family protein